MDKFISNLQEQFQKMCSTGKLFRADISGREVFQLYLMAFPEGSNPVFRDPASTMHNCNHCNNFIRRYGNIVAIGDNGELTTMFSNFKNEGPYKEVADSLHNLIKSRKIENVFFETFDELNSLPYERCTKTQASYRLGIEVNHKKYTKEEVAKFGVVNENQIYEFKHVYVDLPKAFVNVTGASIGTIEGDYREKYKVFKRAMEEFPQDILTLVKDLINQGSLLDGTSHLHAIEGTIKYKNEYENVLPEQKDNWLWDTTYLMNEGVAKFRNTLLGQLCIDLATGDDLNEAVQKWNKRVDPANYMKASAPITKKQIEEAQKFVVENGYLESFNRRLATIDDISVDDIKHISSNSKIKTVTIFDNVKPTAPAAKVQKFDGIEEVPIEKFMADILPTCSAVEVYLLNKQEGNLVTMTTTNSKESKPIFKWPNNYSWDFNGNLAGKSQIKEAVQAKGGKVDGVLRFSIMWGEGDRTDNSDLDAHAQEPQNAHGNHIYYSERRFRKDHGGGRTPMSGQLDVDITQPNSYGNKNIVENIAWSDRSKMKDGVYKLWVHQFSDRGSKGFRAEIEFDGEIYSYEYNQRVSGNVQVAEVTMKDGKFTIKHIIPATNASKEIWGLETNQFHKVNLVCLSPNHWGQNAVGNKHYFFMLEGAKTDKAVRGFHNENLLPDLLAHRKVMEVLGAQNKIDPAEKQLSGIGFNSTVHDEVILKLTGSFNRTIKVKI